MGGVQYLARQDPGWNGTFAKTEFYLSGKRDVFDGKPMATIFKKRKTPQTFRFPKTLEDAF